MPFRLRAFGVLLQTLGRTAEEEVAHLALDRPAQQQPEHATRVDVEPVCRAGASLAEVLEVPPALERLRVALLLHPGDARRLLVAEPEPRLDRLHLRVGLRLDQLRALVL